MKRTANHVFHRWQRFGVVGLIGVGVQLAVLWGLTRAGTHYLVATLLAVETALLHNYLWHVRWTWQDRDPRPGQFYRFHVANGLVSLLSNLAWMRLLSGWLHWPVLWANVVAISATALLNFMLGDRWVFSDRLSSPSRLPDGPESIG